MFKESLCNILTLFSKEVKSYFRSPVGYVFIVFFTIISNGLFFIINPFFEQNLVTMRAYFNFVPWLYLFLVPAITMRTWSEERKSGTIEFLFTSPLTEMQIIISKFLSSLAFLLIALTASLTIPITLMFLGKIDLGVIFASYVGSIFMGMAYIAIGIFFSACTDNQIVAFITSLVAIFFLLILGILPVYLGTIGWFPDFLVYLSLSSHFENVTRGVIDSRDLIYYVSIVVLFLSFNTYYLKSRKWR